MASPSELGLDMKPQSYSMLLRSLASSVEYQLPEPKQLEEFLACLEDERIKIEAFKRELPLCMQLLSSAVETSRQKLQAVKSSNQGTRPVLEEFIPLKSPATDGEADMDVATKTDKCNWMVSAQLWSQTPNKENNNVTDLGAEHPDMGLNINNSSTTGAFIPFSKDIISTSPITLPTYKNNILALANNQNEHQLLEEKKKQMGSELISDYCQGNMIQNDPNNNSGADTLTTSNNTTYNNSSNQTHRKARRCWSPDLHRKFVNALQMLGGSQVATPKQIRELMKVDGLTNDEVKSHLQKYRLHTRRPSPSPPPPAGTASAQLVVLGGIWVPPEYAAHQYYQRPVGPDFYHGQQLFHIHQQQMQAVEVYNKSNTASSRRDYSSSESGSVENNASKE